MIVKSDFGRILNRIRKEKGLTLKQIAQMANRSESTVSLWISGKNEPKMGVIEDLADKLNVSVDYLVTGVDRPSRLDYESQLLSVATRKVPVLGSISAGNPIYTQPDYETVVTSDSVIKCDYALQVAGDSMINAGIQDGDYVFIRKMDTLNNGDIAAIGIDDRITLKRFYHYPDKNMVVLKPENSNYEDQYYVGYEIDQIHILGKAVGLSRAL